MFTTLDAGNVPLKIISLEPMTIIDVDNLPYIAETLD